MKLEHWDPERDGPLSEAALINKLEKYGYDCTRYTYPPGTVFPEHCHETDKIDAVLKGKFKMSMAGESVVLQAGDCLHVPAGMIHRAEVINDTPVISIDAVKTR
jgi:quercetin dioxygenase-like cupin family protein